MEVQFPPELQAKLDRAAAANSSAPEAYLEQLVALCVDHDTWFREKVGKGIQQLDRGEYLTHEEMGERIEQMFRS